MTLDATPGGPNSNAYLTVAEADAIALEQGLGRAVENWLATATTTADKERALIRATSEIDAYMGAAGTPANYSQALLYPRAGVDVDGLGAPYLPHDLEMACFEQAVHVLANADQIADADTRRARGLISFSDDDGSGSVVSVKPEFGMIASKALAYLRSLRGFGLATLRSVPVASTYS